MKLTFLLRSARLPRVAGAFLAVGLMATGAHAQDPEQGPGAARARADLPRLTPRQREILRGVAEYAPWDCPDRWLHELGPARRRGPVLRRKMLESTSWVSFLAYAALLDWSGDEPSATCRALLEALPGVTSGKVRQNVIFLVALTAPDGAASLGPLLGDPALSEADRADVGCALAGVGDDAGLAFFREAFAGSDCMRGEPVYSFADYVALEEREGARAMTRSYRTWELLFRRPYFRRLQYLTRSGLYTRGRDRLTEVQRRALVRRVLPLFPLKWPGHPGSDDFAATLCDFALGAGRRLEAYRWAQRSTLLPDQDRGLRDVFTALAESQLSLEDLDALLDSPDGQHNRAFLLHTRFMSLARRDLSAGLAYFDGLAKADPAGLFAHARKDAARVDVPKGLRDGASDALSIKLLVAYPPRSRALAKTPTKSAHRADDTSFEGVLTAREREVARRTQLGRRDSIQLSVWKVATQYRLLLELRELDKAEAEEDDAALKADLRYRKAAIVAKNPTTFFPVWGTHTMNFGYALNRVRCDVEADARLRRYVAGAFSLRRAYALFASVLRDYPGYAAKDKVLFNLGQCYAKLMDYRPAKGVDVWVYPDAPEDGERPLAFAHRRVAEIFERLASECPASPLADDAERAASYRRRMVRRIKRRRG